jgi:proline iminopeptidase
MTPDKFTNQEFMLDVGDGHQIYVHDWGNKDAKTPILHLHGGPGGQSKDRHKSRFDPETQRVIFHDQRSCGQSTPYGSLQNNTTQDLISDIDKIVERFELDKFVLVGGSWGSALALFYGIAQPKRVAGMVLDGVFTASQQEFDWISKGIWRIFYPDVWQRYLETVPAAERANPTEYHFKQAAAGKAKAAKKAAYNYIEMEAALIKLDDRQAPRNYDDFDPTDSLLAMHYISNGCFVENGHVLNNAAGLTMPIEIVQGRYDMLCPPQTAHRLDQALPNSRLTWTINGHLGEHEYSSVQKILLEQLLKEV